VGEEKPILLIVEDDLDVADMLNAYFRVQGYEVAAVHWGEDALKACEKEIPDIVILDIRLPDIDGYEVARRLRSNRRTKEIPIIFLTEKRGRSDRLTGLELGADDYITKPFDVQELRLRVRNALRRSSQGTLTNPVTNLPEGALVDEKLSEYLNRGGWALLMVSLNNLEYFREDYGFVASDDVLRAVSLMIHNAIRDQGSPNDFLGQLTHTDFILFTSANGLSELRERIRTRLEQSLDYFYPLKDRERAGQGERLEIQIKQLLAQDKHFEDLSQFKKALLKLIR
jgi:DNA-binding response OmpR family regulator